MITDLKYINMLGLYVERFRKTDHNEWNMRCPICGDSKKSSSKARGWINVYKGKYFYSCWNCGVNFPFPTFLKKINPALYSEYRMDKLNTKYGKRSPNTDIEYKPTGKPKFKKANDPAWFTKLCPFADAPQEIREYLFDRQIPEEFLDKYFYYTDAFKHISNLICKETFKSEKNDERRIIIVLRGFNGEPFGIQGRELDTHYAKYLTVKIPAYPKLFGMDRISFDKAVNIVEGPIDSLFLDNCLATCGSDLLNEMTVSIRRKRLIYDNEPRSKIICRKIKKAIDSNEYVTIFPESISQKDINDMHIHGVDVNKLIQERTYRGLRAMSEFAYWKKVQL